jgi:CheY-like chemotaxis protein
MAAQRGTIAASTNKWEGAMLKTILVVDDKANMRKLVQEHLAEEGFRVVAAENGRNALFVARHEKPDLILLDLMMPEMGGYEFMRAYTKEADTPIILLTARVEEADKVLGPDASFPGPSSSPSCKASPSRVSSVPWTSTSATCAPRSSRSRANHATSRRYLAWAIASVRI